MNKQSIVKELRRIANTFTERSQVAYDINKLADDIILAEQFDEPSEERECEYVIVYVDEENERVQYRCSNCKGLYSRKTIYCCDCGAKIKRGGE